LFVLAGAIVARELCTRLFSDYMHHCQQQRDEDDDPEDDQQTLFKHGGGGGATTGDYMHLPPSYTKQRGGSIGGLSPISRMLQHHNHGGHGGAQARPTAPLALPGSQRCFFFNLFVCLFLEAFWLKYV
jgi:hypothetical protein